MNYIKYLQNSGTITYANESSMPSYKRNNWYGNLVSGLNGSRYSVHPGVYNFYTNEDGSISWGDKTGYVVTGSDGKQYVDFEVDSNLSARPELKTYQRFQLGSTTQKPQTHVIEQTAVQEIINPTLQKVSTPVRSKPKTKIQLNRINPVEYNNAEGIKSRYSDFTLANANELFASAKPRYSEVSFIAPENSYSGHNTVKETFEFRPSNYPMIKLGVVDPDVSFSNTTKVQFKNGFLSPFNNKSYSYAIGNNKNIFTRLDIYDPETKKTTSYNISPDNPLYKRFKFSEQDPGNWLDAETYYNIVKNLNTPGYFGSVYAPGRQISNKASYVSKAGYPVYDILNKGSEIDPDSDFTKNSFTYKKPDSEKSWYETIYPKFDNTMGRIVGFITPDVIKHTEYIPGGKNNSKEKKTNVEGDEITIRAHKCGGTLNYLNYFK